MASAYEESFSTTSVKSIIVPGFRPSSSFASRAEKGMVIAIRESRCRKEPCSSETDRDASGSGPLARYHCSSNETLTLASVNIGNARHRAGELWESGFIPGRIAGLPTGRDRHLFFLAAS